MASLKQTESLSTAEGTFDLCWSEHALGEQKCLRLKVKLARSFSAIPLLKNASDWAFAWRGRDDGFLTLALDALLVISEADRMLMGRDSVLQWFGGQTFYTEGAPEWGDLRRGLWFLPAVTWKLADDQSILIIQSLGSGDAIRQDMKARLSSLLEEAFGTEAYPEIAPGVIERTDIPSRSGWRSSLESAKKGFKDGLFSKVVMSRMSQLKLDREDSWLFWLEKLLEYREESYIFAIKSPDGHAFLGRSPERLLAWKEGVFQVDAIAGTRKRGASTESDQSASKELQLSQKDLIEHRYVSQYVSNLLKSLSLHFEVVDDERILQLRHVQHLRTRFQGQLTQSCDALELLKYLHPTPAVGGLPTAEAMEFIRQHEVSSRGWYAGYIGWCSQSSGECAIGIRSALVYRDSIQVFAGAGIVQDSDIDAEWEETELKMQNFLRLIDSAPSSALMPKTETNELDLRRSSRADP
ncbi:MAG: isochorismate synthase [Proteobacteria bacterium]|nr:MAG: isochorismate synthase [Pseudomonadota bacterium]